MADNTKRKTYKMVDIRRINFETFTPETSKRFTKARADSGTDVLEFAEFPKIVGCVNDCPSFSQYDAAGELHGVVQIYHYFDGSKCVYKTHYTHGVRDADIVIYNLRDGEKTIKSVPNEAGLIHIREFHGNKLIKECCEDANGVRQGSSKIYENGKLVEESDFRNGDSVLTKEYSDGNIVYQYEYNPETNDMKEQRSIGGEMRTVEEKHDGLELSYYAEAPYCLSFKSSRIPWKRQRFYNKLPSGRWIKEDRDATGFRKFREDGSLEKFISPSEYSDNCTEQHFDTGGALVKKVEFIDGLPVLVNGQPATMKDVIENSIWHMGAFVQQIQKAKERQGKGQK